MDKNSFSNSIEVGCLSNTPKTEIAMLDLKYDIGMYRTDKNSQELLLALGDGDGFLNLYSLTSLMLL